MVPGREHFIPLRRGDLVTLLVGRMSAEEGAGFRRFCDRLCDRVHLEFYRLFDRLKEDYAPFDPDADTRAFLNPVVGDERLARGRRLYQDVDRLLERANFVKLTDEEVLSCQRGSSHWGLAMSIDLGVFDYFAMYYRGRVMGHRPLKNFKTWFRTKIVDVEIYQRLVIVIKQKAHPRLGRSADDRSVFLKLFKDIPIADVEMLVPGARVQMPKLDRGKLGFSVLSGLAMLAYQIVSTFVKAAATGLMAYGPAGMIAALFGYGYRQYYGYQFSLRSYNLKLAQSLYYQNLDNNGGVLYRLLDAAEEQECREAILAYHYILKHGGEVGVTRSGLDDLIEAELEQYSGVRVDFEIDDAVRKLESVGFIERDGPLMRVVPLEAAIAILESLPAAPVFAREIRINEPVVDLRSNARDRDVGGEKDLRARPEPAKPG